MIQEWPHVNNIARDFNDPIFLAAFGDLKLVFRDQEVISYFKALLSLLSQDWHVLLKLYPETELVLLPEFSVAEFFGEMLKDQDAAKIEEAGQADLEDIFLYNEGFIQIKKEEKEEDNSSSLIHFNISNQDILNELPDKIEDTFTDEAHENAIAESVKKVKTYEEFVSLGRKRDKEANPGPVVDLNGLTGSFYLPGIKEDFQWPPHLAGPSSHSMVWRRRPGKTGEVVTLMGNRSVRRVLEDAGQLGQQAAFLLPCQDREEQLVGVLHLPHFAAGQAASCVPAFQLQGREDLVSLEQLVSLTGYTTAQPFDQEGVPSRIGDPIYSVKTPPGDSTIAARVLLYIGDDMTDLKSLANIWKQVLLQDSRRLKQEKKHDQETKQEHQESLEQKKQRIKRILVWVRSKCVKTTNNATVCIYCGFICHESLKETNGNFMRHIHLHLFRKKVNYKATKRLPCSGCSKIFTKVYILNKHQKQVHNLFVEDKIQLKECPFCRDLIVKDDMNKHTRKLHLNAELKCKDCENIFSSVSLLRNHERNVHIRKYKGFCNTCQTEVPTCQGISTTTTDKPYAIIATTSLAVQNL